MSFDFFNDDEITKMRADVANTMTETAYVLRMTAATGLYAAYGGTMGTVGTLSCRLDRLNRQSGDGIIADAEIGRTFYQLTVPYNADIRDGDDVKVNGVTFTLLTISHAQSSDIMTRGVVAAKSEGN